MRSRFLLSYILIGGGCFTPANEGETDGDASTGSDSSASTQGPTSAPSGTSPTTMDDATTTSASSVDDTTATSVGSSGETGSTDPTTASHTMSGSSSDDGAPVCGNGVPEGNEECDDANLVNTDECKNNCTLPFCGDGVVTPGEGEECDDGNQNDEDLCTTLCLDAACGDGFVQGGEQCDDGNVISHDGCNALCVNEPFCESFEGFDCPSGATMFCDTSAIACDSSDDAVAACNHCNGEEGCQAFQDPGTCNEANGAADPDVPCASRLVFVHYGDICNSGIVTLCTGSEVGTWCTP